MKRTTTFLLSGIIFFLMASFVLNGDDTSSIENRTYKITISESKKGKSGKPEAGVCSIKSGKFDCDFFKKNAGIKSKGIPIELTKDSTYTDEGAEEEMVYAEFEGSMVNVQDEDVKISGTIDGYKIEGNVEISKKGKLKKHWDFIGDQKDKKSKK